MLKFPDYLHLFKSTSFTTSVTYKPAFFWLHPYNLPVGVVSIDEPEADAPEPDLSAFAATPHIIKIPAWHTNSRGNTVPVIAISRDAFVNHEALTDVILPPGIKSFPAGAFAGCTNLKRITIPKNIRRIHEGTFAGCDSLEDVYYEGSMEDWAGIDIVRYRHEIDFGGLIPGTPVEKVEAERLLYVPGNDALLKANIHFNCDLGALVSEADETGPYLTKITIAGKDATDFFKTM